MLLVTPQSKSLPPLSMPGQSFRVGFDPVLIATWTGRKTRPKSGRFFMIWGRDDADLASKLSNAKAEGALRLGDRFDTRIWTYSVLPPPPPRWISLDEMTCDELAMIAAGEDREARPLHSSTASQWSDAELSEIYANGLRCSDRSCRKDSRRKRRYTITLPSSGAILRV